MVKKITIFLLLLSSLSPSKVLVHSKYNLKIDTNAFESENFVVISILSVEKESLSREVISYIKNENGNYIRYNGNFYYTSDNNKYRLVGEKFVKDENGPYVYASEFFWARNEKQRYILSDFYKKIVTKEKLERFVISGYLIEIDSSNFYILSFTPFVFYVRDFNEVEKKILTIQKNENHFSVDKYDIVVNFINTPSKLKSFILSKLQEDDRYNIYDREYLEELLKDISLKDALKGINIKFRTPNYVINIDTVEFLNDKFQKDYMIFLKNDMNGQFLITGEKVEVGRFYQKENDAYILDKEKGKYVKVLNYPWRKERFKYASEFYDISLKKGEGYTNYYLTILLNVIDVESAKIVYSNILDKNIEFPQFSYSLHGTFQNSEIEKLNNLFLSLSEDVKEKLRKVFYLTSVVKDVDGLNVFLYDGKNIGIKEGQIFRIFDNHFTQGYLKVKSVEWNESSGNVFYLIGEINKFNLASESFHYPSRIGISFTLNNLLELGAKIKFLDLYGFENFSFLFGITYKELYVGFSKRFSFIDTSLKVYYNSLTDNMSFDIGIFLTSFSRISLFNSSGNGIFIGYNLTKQKISFGYELGL
ncbi:hypothetical protein SU69_02325 [Thermosipho melanesiensis]|uniref:Uncharacterized protein n=2 Tax=Thermosipho melanesiensis TaxID=46541 RepID=A6LK64_THEM4|nr:hypothetical protein [Thermosipho melanesiensis]ABR30315.1 hypothetical protein Tmel_0448 [Thermosipho melanesiensis BI429]APT73484.1 hypothetical protein BW47_02430 [Thermosipho melanesiensis]OOC37436.1 hypothetical protein SU68_02335 [Thermosipho melanesiensis]OOC39798.1 hypothetical protein SU69_02325 [Thermosipho melanesiensis]OOC39903.1 hypothetical protein SU70_02320 [Thermosipho melanesiensis]